MKANENEICLFGTNTSKKINLEDSNQLNEIGFLQLKAKLIPEIQPPLTQRSPSHFHKI